jgi:hypothetical protein
MRSAPRNSLELEREFAAIVASDYWDVSEARSDRESSGSTQEGTKHKEHRTVSHKEHKKEFES